MGYKSGGIFAGCAHAEAAERRIINLQILPNMGAIFAWPAHTMPLGGFRANIDLEQMLQISGHLTKARTYFVPKYQNLIILLGRLRQVKKI